MTHFRYTMFGLNVQSDIEMPQLSPAKSSATDLVISRTPIDHPQRRPSGSFAEFGASEQFLAWETVGAFRVVGDALIEVDPNPGVSDGLVALPLLGSVMATLLQRRGLFVLHAGAVSINGWGIALMGDKGAGKSTTVASIIAAGHSLLADDVAAIQFGPNGHRQIMPAIAQLKLWCETVASTGLSNVEDQGRLHPSIDKSQYNLTTGFAAEPVSLARLYVLRRAEQAAVQKLEPHAALGALLQYSYLARFGQAALGPDIGTHFKRCSDLANAGQVRILSVPNGIDRIPQAIAAIERDLEDGAP